MSNYKFIGGNIDNNYEKILPDKEHIYYNIRIDNPRDGVSNSATDECVYNKQSQTILEKQSNYEATVESWSIRARLPILNCPIRGGTNTNINLTPFKVNYRFTTVPAGVITDYTEDVIFQPDTFALQRPLPKSPNQNNGIQDFETNQYYYQVNSISRFVEMFNDASSRAFQRLNADHGTAHAEFAWIQFDERTKLFSLVTPYSYFGTSGGGTTQISLDAMLYKYFDSIPASFNSYDTTNARDYVFDIIEKNGRQNAYALGNHYAGAVVNIQTNPPAYLIFPQEDTSLHLWSDIKQILITSSSINVRNQIIPSTNFPQKLNQQNSIPNPDRIIGGLSTVGDIDNFNQSKKSVLSYIDYNYSSPNNTPIQTITNREITYIPHIYKWLDLVGDAPLNNLDVEFSVVTDDGRISKMSLPRDGQANIKLKFRKKFV
tara:strand:+ start:472 stop:1764 length:1293 start_codon:yes stop_codon:yes gene_type:complete